MAVYEPGSGIGNPRMNCGLCGGRCKAEVHCARHPIIKATAQMLLDKYVGISVLRYMEA